MTNLWLFLGTVAAYFIALYLWEHWSGGKMSYKECRKLLATLALLCLPVNIGGNVFTVIGNATSEKGVYAVCSLYQNAGTHAFSLVGLGGYQKADKHAITALGIAGYQYAGKDAVQLIGIAGYQHAGHETAVVIGIAGYQRAEQVASTSFGLTGYQDGAEEAITLAGLAIYQRAGDKERTFGAFTRLKAK